MTLDELRALVSSIADDHTQAKPESRLVDLGMDSIAMLELAAAADVDFDAVVADLSHDDFSVLTVEGLWKLCWPAP